MNIQIKNRMKPCLMVSLAIMLIALVMTLTGHGLNLGVDFTGGTLMTYNMGKDFDTADISAVLAANGISDAQIAKVGQDNEVQIRISDQDNTDELRNEFEKSLSEKYPDIRYVDLSRVGAVAGRDLINNAIKSVLVASVLMLLSGLTFSPVWPPLSAFCTMCSSCFPCPSSCADSCALRRRTLRRC